MPRRSAVLATVLALALSCGCGPDRESSGEQQQGATGPLPEQVVYDYQLIESEAGVRRWVLDSDRMTKFPGREDVDLVRVAMDFFRQGEYYSTLVSDSGRANLQTHDVFVWGDVVVTTSDGRRLRTSELHYGNQDGLIRNDVFNVFDHGSDVMTGIGLEATPDLDYIEIKQEVAIEMGDESLAEEAP